MLLRAAQVAEDIGQSHLPELRSMQAWCDMAAGRTGEALALLEELQQTLTDDDSPPVHAWVAMTHADALLQSNRLPEAVRVGRAALAHAEAHGAQHHINVALVRSNTALALIEQGSVTAAIELLGPYARSTPTVSNRTILEGWATLQMLRGELDEAAKIWHGVSALGPAPMEWRLEAWAYEGPLMRWRKEPATVIERSRTLCPNWSPPLRTPTRTAGSARTPHAPSDSAWPPAPTWRKTAVRPATPAASGVPWQTPTASRLSGAT
jgi:ATP/maltotriose-dependent transcriptional regulator MalT